MLRPRSAPLTTGQRLETYEGEQKKNFMLHYNFPATSALVKQDVMTGVGRREVGHGSARRARHHSGSAGHGTSRPYAYRVVSDILESNGSSSMASVCGASLALMDAGIKLKGSVARRGNGTREGRARTTLS